MTAQNPTTLDDLRQAIATRRVFSSHVNNARADYIAVLSYQLGWPTLVGALADDVNRSARDLRDRYMGGAPAISYYATTTGDSEGEATPRTEANANRRALYNDEAVYYVTTSAADNRRRLVLGYVTADGFAVRDAVALAELTPRRRAAIEDGLRDAAERTRAGFAVNGSDGGEVVIRRATGHRIDGSPIVTHETYTGEED